MGKGKRAVVGVDLGGTSLLAAVVDSDGKILGEAKRKTRPTADGRRERGAAGVSKRIAKTVEKAIRRSGLARKQIVGVGIGVPGPVNPDDGVVVRCPNLGPTWNAFHFARRLYELLELPVTIDNDVNVGAVGEHEYGAGRDADDMLAIFVGTGLGGGLIIGGRLRAGARNSAGEVGHMPILADGPVCSCGERGHAEALASRSAIERRIVDALDAGQESLVTRLMEERSRADMTSSVLGDAYEAGDPVVVEAVERAQYYLGILIAACVNCVDPEAVVVGGGVLDRFGDAYLDSVRAVAEQHYINKSDLGRIRIVPAKLGDYSGALGAAVLARQRLG